MEEEFVLEHILRCQGRHVSRIMRSWSHCICSWEAKSEQEVKPAIKHEGSPANDQRPPEGLYLLKFHNLLKGNHGGKRIEMHEPMGFTFYQATLIPHLPSEGDLKIENMVKQLLKGMGQNLVLPYEYVPAASFSINLILISASIGCLKPVEHPTMRVWCIASLREGLSWRWTGFCTPRIHYSSGKNMRQK